MKYADFYECDICNGNGVGVSLFVQGCPFHCKGCFNPETWDFDGGKEWTSDVKKKFFKMVERPYIHRISFLGGSPLCDINVEEVWELIHYIRGNYPNKELWVYTGYKWEDIYDGNYFVSKSIDINTNSYRNAILDDIDVLIDGPFEENKKDINLPFRGSSNQRIIDVQKTLKNNGNIVLWNNERINKYERE